MIRPLLVAWLIIYSLRYLTRPWNFFQLNGKHFNRRKNIFSKLDLDTHIPEKWRLRQEIDDNKKNPLFPVVVKPEWGQNSHGVEIIHSQEELEKNRKSRPNSTVNYLFQELAPGSREFEFFYIRSVEDEKSYHVVSLTETENNSGKTFVVNSIRNSETRYCDLTDKIGEERLQKFWGMVQSIGCYKIARIGMRANSLEELLQGQFHVLETNIFLPMPLMLLDKHISFSQKHRFIRKSMKSAAHLGATLNGKAIPRYPIFFRLLIAHYKVKQ